jgi:hypothetical protein
MLLLSEAPVEERIMHCFSVSQKHNPQPLPAGFGYPAPPPDPSIRLHALGFRLPGHPFDPRRTNSAPVRALADEQEVLRELH